VAQEGTARLEVALPVLADVGFCQGRRASDGPNDHRGGSAQGAVTIEVVDERAVVAARGRFATDNASYHSMLSYAWRSWAHRVCAVAGAGRVGRPLAQRLLADGEQIVDVPAKLAARVRVFDTG
jgi:hypothetical protein